MNDFHVSNDIKLKRLEFETLGDIPTALEKKLFSDAEAMLEEPLDTLPLSLYKDFLRTGNRVNYETPYFRKRQRLSTFVIAELIEDKGRFMDRIEDEVWSILGEPGWVMPAHNTYVRDTIQLPVPEVDRPVLDLFAMESGEIVALTLNLLESKLTPSLVRTMAAELRRRIIDPYLSSWFWWMGRDGKERLNNWTVWCTQNVLLTAFALSLTQDEYHAVLDKALLSLSDWYSQYGDDGCCDEGAHYWHAAGLCFFGAVRVVNEVSGGAISSLYKEDKMRNIASYILNMHIGGEWYINFADCSPKAGELGAREYLFGCAIGCDELKRQAMLDFRYHVRILETGGKLPFDDNQYNLWYKWLKFRYADTLMHGDLPAHSDPTPYVYYPSVGLSIYRKNDILLAVKTGGNDDSHNHNDTGSVILFKGEHPVLCDIGVETYTQKTFSAERYTLLPMQSLYHNLVNFDGIGQNAGKDYAASEVESGPDGISMELSGAYPKGTVSSYKRHVSLRGNNAEFCECVKGGKNPVLSLIVMDKPAIDGERIEGEGWSISFEGAKDINIEKLDITDKRLRIAWPDALYRVLVSFGDRLDWKVEL